MADRRKRARTTGVSVVPRAKRPIDKQLIGVAKTAVNATQVTTVLKTTTFPCTIVGVRWSLTAFQDAGTAPGNGLWAIVIVRDGNNIANLTAADGADFYTPEQDVLGFGVLVFDDNVKPWSGEGHTKTMRKMMGGDQLVFLVRGEATNTFNFEGVVQFFCKS